MAYLPSDRSEMTATKSDIAGLANRLESLDTRFDRLEMRFDRLEMRSDRLEMRFDGLYDTIIDMQKFYARTTVWSMVGLTAVFSFVVALFG